LLKLPGDWPLTEGPAQRRLVEIATPAAEAARGLATDQSSSKR
jgi:hypothetical protein